MNKMMTKTIEANVSKEITNNYFAKNVVADFSTILTHEKLTFLQNTPKNFIKTREISGTKIPYIEHEYAEKALNFVFNFNVSCEVMHREFREAEVMTKNGKKKTFEAEAEVKFTFKNSDGYTIVRTVYSSHRAFESAATTRGDAMKSAISKAWTVVARTFGIGSNLAELEKAAYRKVEEYDERTAANSAPSPVPAKRAWSK